MRRLEGCPNSSASTAWDYAGLLSNLYRDADPNRRHHFQTSRPQSPLNPCYTRFNMLLTPSSPEIPPYSLLTSPLSLPPLRSRELGGQLSSYRSIIHRNKTIKFLTLFLTRYENGHSVAPFGICLL